MNGQKRKLRAKVVASKLKRQSDKERKKVAREIVKIQQLGAEGTNPQLEQLRLEGSSTRSSLNELIAAFNGNSQAYSGAFQHIDARIGAVMLVLDDLTASLTTSGVMLPELTTKVDEPSGRTVVFWEAYIKHYIDNVRKELEARAAAASAAPPLYTPEAEQTESNNLDVVFGGNDGEASSRGSESASG